MRSEIGFFIHPTDYQDYDVIAIGSLSKLLSLKRKYKSSDLIKKSKFGNVPILIMDTSDTVIEAKCIIDKLKKELKCKK